MANVTFAKSMKRAGFFPLTVHYQKNTALVKSPAAFLRSTIRYSTNSALDRPPNYPLFVDGSKTKFGDVGLSHVGELTDIVAMIWPLLRCSGSHSWVQSVVRVGFVDSEYVLNPIKR